MTNSLKQHKILKLLLKHFNDKSYTTSSIPDEAKALSSEDIHRKTSYKLDSVNLILSSLHNDEYIDNTKIHGKGDIIFWYITDKGKSAIANNTFVWINKTDNIFKVLTFIIAIIGLLNSIFHFIGTPKQ